MNFLQLFHLQQKLSNSYYTNTTLNEDILISQKILSLQASIGTLSAKTKCFYYWDTNVSFEKNEIIDYYNKCLSAILSIGIDRDFTDLNFNIKPTDHELTSQFLTIYIDISDFLICSSEDQYYTLLEDYLNLGISLGFTIEELQNNFKKFLLRFNEDKKLNISI